MKTEASVSNLILDIYKYIVPEKEWTDLSRTELQFVYSNKYKANCVVVDFGKLISKPSTIVVRDYRLFKKDLKSTYNAQINDWVKQLSKAFKSIILVDDRYLGVILDKGYNRYIEAKINKPSEYFDYNKKDLDTIEKGFINKSIIFKPTDKLKELQQTIIQQAKVFNSDAYWLNLLKDNI